MADVGDEAPVDTMHYSLAEMEGETHLATAYDVHDKASADTLVDRLAEVKPKKLGRPITVRYSGIKNSTSGARDTKRHSDRDEGQALDEMRH